MMSKKKQKTIRLSDETRQKVDFLKKVFDDCSDNMVFVMAINKLYKEYKE